MFTLARIPHTPRPKCYFCITWNYHQFGLCPEICYLPCCWHIRQLGTKENCFPSHISLCTLISLKDKITLKVFVLFSSFFFNFIYLFLCLSFQVGSKWVCKVEHSSGIQWDNARFISCCFVNAFDPWSAERGSCREHWEITLLITILRLYADLQQSYVYQEWQDVKDGDFFSSSLDF